MANTLFLRLEGPMQSWGERSRWSIRDTAQEPTKSGIVGLLACSLGWGDDEQLQELSSSLRVGVRCDQPGVTMRDYHTVVGGVLSAEGKIKKTASTKRAETVVSQRYYLADASFLVAIQADPERIEQLALAVQNPAWPPYLGRKSCPMSLPIFCGTGEYASLKEALCWKGIQPGIPGDQATRLRGVIEAGPADRDAIRRRDEVDSRKLRTFQPRYVVESMLDVLSEFKEGS
jgi:CRISPR system Cascade subunit CasD